MIDEFQVVVHTLRELDETEHCPTAHGYLALLTEFRFLTTLYVLGDVLPILACLSKTFQKGKFNFSQIKPSIRYCKAKLNVLLRDSTPVHKLEMKLRKRSMQRSFEQALSLPMVSCRRHASSCQRM